MPGKSFSSSAMFGIDGVGVGTGVWARPGTAIPRETRKTTTPHRAWRDATGGKGKKAPRRAVPKLGRRQDTTTLRPVSGTGARPFAGTMARPFAYDDRADGRRAPRRAVAAPRERGLLPGGRGSGRPPARRRSAGADRLRPRQHQPALRPAQELPRLP